MNHIIIHFGLHFVFISVKVWNAISIFLVPSCLHRMALFQSCLEDLWSQTWWSARQWISRELFLISSCQDNSANQLLIIFINCHFLTYRIFDGRKFPEKLQTFGSNRNFPSCRNRSGLKTFGSGKVLGSFRIAARKPLTKVPFGMKYP